MSELENRVEQLRRMEKSRQSAREAEIRETSLTQNNLIREAVTTLLQTEPELTIELLNSRKLTAREEKRRRKGKAVTLPGEVTVCDYTGGNYIDDRVISKIGQASGWLLCNAYVQYWYLHGDTGVNEHDVLLSKSGSIWWGSGIPAAGAENTVGVIDNETGRNARFPGVRTYSDAFPLLGQLNQGDKSIPVQHDFLRAINVKIDQY